MRLALLTAQLSSAAGGLATSVPSLAHGLAEEGLDVHVCGGRDPDRPEDAARWAPNVHALERRGPRALHFTRNLPKLLAALSPHVTDVQGLWTYPSLANLRHHRRHGTPYVVTPRGMLDPWARANSAWKKRLALAAFERAHLCDAACLRATAEMEAEHFRSAGLRNPIAIVPNAVEIADLQPRAQAEAKRLLFLSRIHPKKGLPLLLRAWQALSHKFLDWELVIAGPEENGHEREMKSLAQALRLPRLRFLGEVHGRAKDLLYRSADLFVLPTYAENFGLVVAEALAQEVPVVTTRNAPWLGLQTHRCGWWIDLDQQRLTDTLAGCMALPQAERHDMGARGRAWMMRDFAAAEVARQMCSVYEWVGAKAVRPDCVFD